MDKNKVIEGAAKLVAKGAYDKAIKEYQKVLEVDPRDVRVLQKMGELFQKKNENAQAAHYFSKVAESYASDGFFLKAVALYKQVLKLNPALVEVNVKLAELHQQLGLMSEATTYYQVVANHHDKAGDARASLDTLKKMVELDPENVGSRIKLADLYARQGLAKEATAEFKRASDHLKRTGRSEDLLRVTERLATLEPENVQLNRELALSYLQRGDQKRALARLQVCFKADPRDVETLQLLAQAFQGLGQVAKTVSVYKELAKVYQDRGQTAQAESIWTNVKALDPTDPDLLAHQRGSQPPARASSASSSPPAPAWPTSSPPAPARSASAPPAPARSTISPPAPAARPPAAPPGATPAPGYAADASGASGDEQMSKVLTETDVYVKYGLYDKALERLQKVFAADPENLDAHEKAYQVYVAANQSVQAADQLLNVLRLCTREGDAKRAQPYLTTILQTQPHHPEVPAFVAALGGAGAAALHGEGNEAVSDDAILVVTGEVELDVDEPPGDALGHIPRMDVTRGMSSRRPSLVPEVVEPFHAVEDDEPLTYGEDEPFHAVEDDEPLDVGGDEDVLALAQASADVEASGELELAEPLEDAGDD
ncbi:MAG: tetratricopeptide repeat protein, partial [Myxococcaceae bacterium]|nr:tetratricopeptide repeat protein [Myxococcaceae bacterium]